MTLFKWSELKCWCWPLCSPPSLKPCVFYPERTEGHACASPWVHTCLFDWLTLLSFFMWTIKSKAGLKREGLTADHSPLSVSLLFMKRSQLWPLYSVYLVQPVCGLRKDVEGEFSIGRCLWGNETHSGEGDGRQGRLFCSLGSVSEHTPMQLRQLALPCLNPRPPPQLTTHAHMRTHTSSSELHLTNYTQPAKCVLHVSLVCSLSLNVISLAMWCSVWACLHASPVCAYLNVCLTASNDASLLEGRGREGKGRGEARRGGTPSCTIMLSHWISQASAQRGSGAHPWEWHRTSTPGHLGHRREMPCLGLICWVFH